MKKNIHPTLVWSLIGAIATVVLLAMFIDFGQLAPLIKKTPEAMVLLDYGNGKVRRFKGPIIENARAWDLFQQAIAIGGINVEITDHFVPQNIDGFENGEKGKTWNLYVNNVKQKFAPFEVQVKPGDEVVFRFE